MLLCASQVYPPNQLPELIAASDYVVAALPSTPATKQLINEEAINAMQSHAVFVNVGRGLTVDEAALIKGRSFNLADRPAQLCMMQSRGQSNAAPKSIRSHSFFFSTH